MLAVFIPTPGDSAHWLPVASIPPSAAPEQGEAPAVSILAVLTGAPGSTPAVAILLTLGATITNSPAVEQFWPPGAVSVRRIVRPEIARTISLARPSQRPLTIAAQAVYDVIERFAIEAVRDGRWQRRPLC